MNVIIKKQEDVVTPFSAIHVGELFIYMGGVYNKIPPVRSVCNNEDFNAVRLTTGLLVQFNAVGTSVTRPKTAQLTVEV